MKLRHELKYYINHSDYLSISSKLKSIVPRDRNSGENGRYGIRSIYFDDYNDKALMEKLTGVNHREKFRIRLYNHNLNYIRLEKKIKFRGLTEKISEVISKDEVESVLKGEIEFLRNSGKQLFMELYVKMRNGFLKPKTIVDYFREAYVFTPGNVRITFDMDIRSGIFSRDVANFNLPAMAVIPKGYIVLEVKYDEFIPELIMDMIQIDDRSKTAISKYALSRTCV